MSTQIILEVLALRHRLYAPALETLRRRYAAGEISHEEYDRMLEAIERRSSRDDRH